MRRVSGGSLSRPNYTGALMNFRYAGSVIPRRVSIKKKIPAHTSKLFDSDKGDDRKRQEASTERPADKNRQRG